MLKKMIFVLVGFTFVFTIIWVAIGYDRYGSDLLNHHLNLQAMVTKVKDTWYSFNIYDNIKMIMKLTNYFGEFSEANFINKFMIALTGIDPLPKNNDFLTFVFNAFNILISPINCLLFGFALLFTLIYCIFMLIITCSSILMQILEFIFNPMFI